MIIKTPNDNVHVRYSKDNLNVENRNIYKTHNVNKLLWQITGGNKQHRLFDVQCLIGHIEKTSEKRITISESVNDFSNCLIPPNKVDKELSKIIKFVQQFKSQKQLKSDKRLELTE